MKRPRVRMRAVFAAADLAWTPFLPAVLRPEQVAQVLAIDPDHLPGDVWLNSRYEVWQREIETPLGPMTHLSIKRRDKNPIRDWRDMQRIKNDICGPEREAVELYPAESRLVDTSNQFHLWVLPAGHSWPFGYNERLVIGEPGGGPGEAKQRPFAPEHAPADITEGCAACAYESKHAEGGRIVRVPASGHGCGRKARMGELR